MGFSLSSKQSSHQTKRNNKKLTSTGLKQQQKTKSSTKQLAPTDPILGPENSQNWLRWKAFPQYLFVFSFIYIHIFIWFTFCQNPYNVASLTDYIHVVKSNLGETESAERNLDWTWGAWLGSLSATCWIWEENSGSIVDGYFGIYWLVVWNMHFLFCTLGIS